MNSIGNGVKAAATLVTTGFPSDDKSLYIEKTVTIVTIVTGLLR
jgi:hypothetical protein